MDPSSSVLSEVCRALKEEGLLSKSPPKIPQTHQKSTSSLFYFLKSALSLSMVHILIRTGEVVGFLFKSFQEPNTGFQVPCTQYLRMAAPMGFFVLTFLFYFHTVKF